MPRFTRDQQFQASFKEFMVSIRDLYYPDLNEWRLESQTANKSSCIHQYNFNIPKKTVIYTIDAYTDPMTGVTHPPETGECDQEMPEIRDFAKHFEAYFGKYILRLGGALMSYTSLVNIKNSESGDLVAGIVVAYSKSYLPYFSRTMSADQLQERNKVLEEENQTLNDTLDVVNTAFLRQRKSINRLTKQVEKVTATYELKLQETIRRMQGKLREYYQESNKTEDCPVCYDSIRAEQLMTPGCCHYICEPCHDRCHSCPICREEY
jgi:hypothetical protein